MKKTLEQVALEYNELHNYGDDEENLRESIIECLSKGVVSERTESEHRWYDRRIEVHKFIIDGEERFFEVEAFHTTGDACIRDMDVIFQKVAEYKEVFPTEVTMVVYK